MAKRWVVHSPPPTPQKEAPCGGERHPAAHEREPQDSARQGASSRALRIDARPGGSLKAAVLGYNGPGPERVRGAGRRWPVPTLSPPPWAAKADGLPGWDPFLQSTWESWAGTLPALSSGGGGVLSPTQPRRHCLGPRVHTRSRAHVYVLSPALWAWLSRCSCLPWAGEVPGTPISARLSTSADATHGPQAMPGRHHRHRNVLPAPAGPADSALWLGWRELSPTPRPPGPWLQLRKVSTGPGETGPQEPSAPSPAWSGRLRE